VQQKLHYIYPWEGVVRSLGSTKAAIQLLKLMHFKELVELSTRINGSTIGELEIDGWFILKPVQGEFYTVDIPLFQMYHWGSNANIFYPQFPQYLFGVNEDTLPRLCLTIHYTSYRLLALVGEESVPLHIFYRGGAKGDQGLLQKLIKVPKEVKIYVAPEIVCIDGRRQKNHIISLKKVWVRSFDGGEPVKQIDTTEGTCLVEIPRRQLTADGVTPHGLEQKKDSAHTSSGWSVPSSKESPKASSISQQQIDTEYEKTKHHMEESGYSLTIISPKPFSGNLEDLPPNVLLVCGDDFWKFTQGFIVHLIASR